jgi:hypothetical protein
MDSLFLRRSPSSAPLLPALPFCSALLPLVRAASFLLLSCAAIHVLCEEHWTGRVWPLDFCKRTCFDSPDHDATIELMPLLSGSASSGQIQRPKSLKRVGRA